VKVTFNDNVQGLFRLTIETFSGNKIQKASFGTHALRKPGPVIWTYRVLWLQLQKFAYLCVLARSRGQFSSNFVL